MPAFKRKSPTDISIVGTGTLATALAGALHRAGFPVSEIIHRGSPQSLERAHALAQTVKAHARKIDESHLDAKLTWICVPDDVIADLAKQIAARGNWQNKFVVHSSGALGSEILAPLQEAGALIGSAHPLMTFVHLSAPDLNSVPFAMEGDRKTLTVVAAVVRALGGKPFRIPTEFKTAYHAFGFFSSPGLVALIAAAQHVGALAGLEEDESRQLMEPIVRQTIDNCFRSTPKQAFSGPLRRGDIATIRKHLEALKDERNLLELYKALCRIALQQLPVGNLDEIRKALG